MPRVRLSTGRSNRPLYAPQRAGEPKTFEQAANPFFERHARCSELLADIRHIGSDANAK
jgi:hypothetical protein